MKVFRNKPQFQEVTLVFQTQEELDSVTSALHWYGTTFSVPTADSISKANAKLARDIREQLRNIQE